MEQKEKTIDEIFQELEEVTKKMEAGTSLEESFALYHEGLRLVKACTEKIDTIEKQILVMNEEGQTHEF